MAKICAIGGGSRMDFNGASRPSRAGPAMLVDAGSWRMLLEDRLPGSAEPQLALPPRPPGANLQIFLGSDSSHCPSAIPIQKPKPTTVSISNQPTNPDPSSIPPPAAPRFEKGPGVQRHISLRLLFPPVARSFVSFRSFAFPLAAPEPSEEQSPDYQICATGPSR